MPGKISGETPHRLFQDMDVSQTKNGERGVKQGKNTRVFHKIFNKEIQVDSQTFIVNRRSWQAFIKRNPGIFKGSPDATRTAETVKKAKPEEKLAEAIVTKARMEALHRLFFSDEPCKANDVNQLLHILGIAPAHSQKITYELAQKGTYTTLDALKTIFTDTYIPTTPLGQALARYQKNPDDGDARNNLEPHLMPYYLTDKKYFQKGDIAKNLPRTPPPATAIVKTRIQKQIAIKQGSEQDEYGMSRLNSINDVKHLANIKNISINDITARALALLIIQSQQQEREQEDREIIQSIFNNLEPVSRYLVLRALPKENVYFDALKTTFWQGLNAEDSAAYQELVSDEKKPHLLPPS